MTGNELKTPELCKLSSNIFMVKYKPLVTIGIPTFNRVGMLARAIDSARKQTYTHIEISISDNASSDDTKALCEMMMALDTRVHYDCHVENMGVIENFKCVLSGANGEYFMWLGDDDWIDCDYVEKCLETLEQDAGLILVCGTPNYYRENRFDHTGRLFDLSQESPYQRLQSYFSKVADNGLMYGVYRTDAIRRFEYSDEFAGDWNFIGDVLVVGKARMLTNTHLHRELGGMSRGYRDLITQFNMPSLAIVFPMLFIAGLTCRHLSKSKAYRALTFSTIFRYWLAILIALRTIPNIRYRIAALIKAKCE